MTTRRVELGCAGHFIAAYMCAWRRHTQVGRYRVSSVGDYYFGGVRQTLGSGVDSFFETMVFETTGLQAQGNEGCGCRELVSLTEIEASRYSSAVDAQRGHERLVKKYIRLSA